MAQVSRPYQIALVVLGVFAAVWMVALRPKATESSPSPATPVAATPAPVEAGGAKAQSGTGRRVETVHDNLNSAHATEQARADASDAVGTDAAPAAAAAAASASAPAVATATSAVAVAPAPQAAQAAQVLRPADLKTLPRPLAVALLRHQVVALLFFNPRSVDDRSVRRAVLSVNRHRGTVAVMTAPIAKLSRYTSITRAVPVLSSPTLVVIDRKLSARAFGGLLDGESVSEAVSDALRD